MKRAPLVLTGTACGLVAVISYHSAVPQASALSSATSGGSTLSVAGSSSSGSSSRSTGSSGSSASSGSSGSTGSASPAGGATAATAGSTAATRSAVGTDYQYPFGDLSVRVTMTGTKLVDVTVVRHDVTDPRSQMIDQIALPELRSQALRAQSAKIDGVSGASYTSAAYEQSLQSALDKLKV